MKTFDERMASIREKSAFEKKKVRNRRILAGTLVSVFAIVLALTLFVPYSTALPDVSMYADSPYYNVIQALNKATYTPPLYKNNFSAILYGIMNEAKGDGKDDMLEGVPEGPMFGLDAPTGTPAPGGQYVEVTDNQVEGVTEADLFKRSDKYLFYLNNRDLYVYSIAQAETALVGSFRINPFPGLEEDSSFCAIEMYLSEDCSTVIVVIEGYTKQEGSLAAVVTLDVSDPANIQQIGSVAFQGSYISSRLVDGEVLLTYNYGIHQSDIDFDKPETFIPTYGTPGNLQPIDGENIVCPEENSSLRYTVVAKLDGKSLEVKDTVALMGYSKELYVSENTIYATHAFTQNMNETLLSYTQVNMTEITGISFLGDELEVLGSVQIEGSVKDQYSMDAYNGILRVAASTSSRTVREYTDGELTSAWSDPALRNCSLYCIDLATWEIAASVEKFAPDGDEVTSARFDGDKAYICTAEIVVMKDPVYFFDLSDIHNITWTDSGIIDGYSSSLVNFGDYLLGIGFSESFDLKLEAYVQGKDGVESLASYERRCSFANKYKAYFIDRENSLVGIPVSSSLGEKYLPLHFDGYKFHVVKEIPMVFIDLIELNETRATIVDGWLYLLYSDRCVAQQVW